MHLTTTHKLDAGASPVHTVTIFQSDCAEVVRKFTIALKPGENLVEISHLPHTMQAESLRVAGIGQAMLSDVVCIMPKSKTSKLGHAGKSEELLKLEEERALFLAQKRFIDHQAGVLVNYARSMTSEHVSPEDMLTFLKSFTAMGEQNAQADVAHQKKLRELERKIEKEIDDPAAEHDNSHLRNIKVKLTINAEEGHVAEISLTYLVKKASWKPVFDLRAVTGADGEDWTEAVLNLSTASPDSFGSHIPALVSMKITPRRWGGGFFQNKVAPNRNVLPGPSSLFSNNNNVNRNTLFGAAPQPQLPTLPAGPFAQQSQQQQQQQQQQQANTSLFGGSSAFGQVQQVLAPSTGGGLFGTTTTNPPATGGFGSSAGLFGQAASNPPALRSLDTFPQAPSNPPQGAAPTSVLGMATGAVFGSTTGNPAAATEDFVHVASTDDGGDDPEALPEMEIPSASTKESSMAANFEVKGNANIRSDGSNHKVAIAVLNFDAKIQTVVVPRSVPGANLHCTIHNSSKDTHLLPGSMAVYLDEGYITNTAVPHVSPGDSFKCSLGRDHSVGVTFDQKSKLLVTPINLFSANRETILYMVRITLKNKRESQIKGLIVRDIVPVSDGEPIEVVLTKPAGLAEAEEGKEVKVEGGVTIKWCESKGEKGGMKEGQLQWTVDLDKRETKVLVLEWEVISPPGRQWAYELHSATRV